METHFNSFLADRTYSTVALTLQCCVCRLSPSLCRLYGMYCG